jgi:SAM-dependent methyltransferase
VLGDDVRELLDHRLPGDHARQIAAEHYAELWARSLRDRKAGAGAAAPEVGGSAEAGASAGAAPLVVDLGCGPGNSVDLFRALVPGVRWVGVDVETSPEVAARTRADAEFRTFDGVQLPVEDAAADLVFCKQTLEHVRAPEPLLRDVARALAPGGWLAGSTSQLEPFHSLSLWNYTPYGLTLLLEDAGLEVVELRPCIDGLTLLVQRGLGMPHYFDRWWARESPLNRFVNLFARAARLDARQANAIKLLLCGQFCFLARRPG